MARKGLVWAGTGAVVGALAVGVLSVVLTEITRNATVEGFARAPVGCTTTLEFDTEAVFTFFVETRGRTDDLGGDCAANGSEYDRGDDDPPRVELTLVRDDGGQMTLDEYDGTSYDTVDFAGTAVAQVTIEEAGTYRLTVASDEDDFAIAIGRDPGADVLLVQALGAALAVLLLALGAVLIVVGVRRPEPPSSDAAPPTSAGGTPTWVPPPPATTWPPSSSLPPGSPLPPPPPPPA